MLMRYEPTVFELGRMRRLPLLTEYFREIRTSRRDRNGYAELRTLGMTNEAIVTSILIHRERSQCLF